MSNLFLSYRTSRNILSCPYPRPGPPTFVLSTHEPLFDPLHLDFLWTLIGPAQPLRLSPLEKKRTSVWPKCLLLSMESSPESLVPLE